MCVRPVLDCSQMCFGRNLFSTLLTSWVVKVLELNFFILEKLLLLEAERGALWEGIGTASGECASSRRRDAERKEAQVGFHF